MRLLAILLLALLTPGCVYMEISTDVETHDQITIDAGDLDLHAAAGLHLGELARQRAENHRVHRPGWQHLLRSWRDWLPGDSNRGD